MKKHWMFLCAFLFSFALTLALFSGNAYAAAKTEPKEWTFLVFINGHNNLDNFGQMNIRQMEEVGSGDKINIVVQWASMKFSTTKRLWINKSTNPNQVTSPVVEELPLVDMGDYQELTKFVEWGAKNYPAKHYFVTVWNHGSGWNLKNRNSQINMNDISSDDRSGNRISTEQLGQSMRDIAKIIGHKVDIYGSDACLMAMAEVAAEVADGVDYFVGSEELEPGEGWPYNTFLKKWTAMSNSTPAEVSTLLTKEYLAAYSGGIYGTQDVTLSAFNLNHLSDFYRATDDLATELSNSSTAQMETIFASAESTQTFDNTKDDFRDFKDFLNQIEKQRGLNSAWNATMATRAAIDKLVIANSTSPNYKRAHGLAIWMPVHAVQYEKYSPRYEGLVFHKETRWGNFLAKMLEGK